LVLALVKILVNCGFRLFGESFRQVTLAKVLFLAMSIFGGAGFQNWRNSFGQRLGKLSFSFGQHVFESIFLSVKVGFQLFGVLVNYGFHSVSESLKNFVLVKYRFWLFGVLASPVFWSLPKVKLCAKICRVGGVVFF